MLKVVKIFLEEKIKSFEKYKDILSDKLINFKKNIEI